MGQCLTLTAKKDVGQCPTLAAKKNGGQQCLTVNKRNQHIGQCQTMAANKECGTMSHISCLKGRDKISHSEESLCGQ
jgi:hypothetical protein